MIRPYTRIRYEAIIRLHESGLAPKEIVVQLNLSSVTVVYKAFAYNKKPKENHHGHVRP